MTDYEVLLTTPGFENEVIVEESEAVPTKAIIKLHDDSRRTYYKFDATGSLLGVTEILTTTLEELEAGTTSFPLPLVLCPDIIEYLIYAPVQGKQAGVRFKASKQLVLDAPEFANYQRLEVLRSFRKLAAA